MSEERLIRVPDWFEAPSTKFPDMSAVLRNPSQTVEEAEAYTVGIGVRADYGESLLIANMVSQCPPAKARGLVTRCCFLSAIFVESRSTGLSERRRQAVGDDWLADRSLSREAMPLCRRLVAAFKSALT